MNHELALSLRDEVTQKHQEAIALDAQLGFVLLSKLEIPRSVGVLQSEAQDQSATNAIGYARFYTRSQFT
jgi:hypothetical protein